MTRNNKTRHALLMSMVSILLCLAMLIGSTFAWFTDTASTSVNKIEAGTLDIELEYATAWGDGGSVTTWSDAKDQTLRFRKATDGAGQEILWEPGVTYNLPELRIANKGNLAVKYKIIVNGVTGSAKLLDVIKFTVKVGNADPTPLENLDGELAGGKAAEPTYSDTIAISGHMDENAGNEYQGLSLSGIGITVVATQNTVEYDSTRKDYDKDAEYPEVVTTTQNVAANVDTNNKIKEGGVTIDATNTTADTSQEAATTTVTLPEGVKIEDTATDVSVSIVETATPATVAIESNEGTKTLEISMTGVDFSNTYTDGTSTAPVIIKYPVGAGLTITKLLHKETEMTKGESANLTAADTYYYDADSGELYLAVTHLSPFTIVYDAVIASPEELAAATDTTAKTVTISSVGLLARFAKSVNADNSRYEGYTVNLTEDIDLGGAKWTPIKMGVGMYFNGNNHTIKNATITATSGDVGFFIGKIYLSDITFENFTVSAIGCDGGASVALGVVSGASGVYAVRQDVPIKNVTVKNSTVAGAKYTGAIVGKAYGRIDMTGCKVENTVVCGQYKAGGAIGFICGCDVSDYSVTVTDNTLTNVTVKGADLWTGKTQYELGKVVGNWCVPKGVCKNNTFTGTTDATGFIGKQNNVTTLDEG